MSHPNARLTPAGRLILVGLVEQGFTRAKSPAAFASHARPSASGGAETAAAATLAVTSRFGIPVSTTHTIGSAIMGVGATRRLSAVRWGIAYNIVLAWVLTFPARFGLGYVVSTLIPD